MKYRYREPNEMKDSGVEWLGMIPREWKKKSLKHELVFSVGGTPSTSKGEYFLGENPWITISDIKKKYVKESKQGLTDEGIRSANMKIVPKGSLLYTFKLSVGQVAFAGDNIYTNEAIASFHPSSKYNISYWYYALANYLIRYANENIYGAKLLNQDLIKNARLLVPNNQEQQKIATFLDQKTAEFDNIIAKKESLINKLEEAKKSLISEVVTGKKEVIVDNGKLTVKNRKAEVMKDSGVEWLGLIPKEWGVKRLKHLGESLIGLTYTPNDIVEENNGTLILRSSNVQNGKLSFNDNVYVNAIIPEKLRTREKDILICARNGSRALIGKNAMINKDNEGLSFGAFMTIYRSKYNDFLFYTLNSNLFVTQAGSFLTSTVNQLTVSNLNNFIISFCQNEKEQQLIVTFLDEKTAKIDSAIEKTKLQIEKLKEAKQSLISESVTGKIEVM